MLACILGFYVLLFSLSTYFLYKSKTVYNRRLHLFWTIAVFVISTFGALMNVSSGIQDAVVIYTAMRSQDFNPFFAYVMQNEMQTAITGITYSCLIIANCIADSVLIHRIYLVWGSKIWIIIFPILSSLVANTFGLAGAVMRIKGTSNSGIASNFALEEKGINYLIGFYFTNAAVNFMLTLLIAGRIWWVGRRTWVSFGTGENCMISKKYKTIIAVLIECGIIYPISLISHAAAELNQEKLAVPINLTPTVIQLAGIAPTLILVRTCLGRSITDKIISSQTTMSGISSTMRFPSQGHTGNSKNMSALVNFQSSQINTSLHSRNNLEVQIEMKSTTDEV